MLAVFCFFLNPKSLVAKIPSFTLGCKVTCMSSATFKIFFTLGSSGLGLDSINFSAICLNPPVLLYGPAIKFLFAGKFLPLPFL